MNHKYGEIKYDIWYDLYGHINKRFDNKVIKLNGYKIKFYDNKEKPFLIAGINTNNVKISNGCCTIAVSCKNYAKFSITHLILSSAFPEVEPHKTVDHINDDPTDNRISNLCWMEQRPNSSKGQEKSIRTIKANGGRNGRWVNILKNIDNVETKIGCFRNINAAASYIHENWTYFRNRCDKEPPKITTIESKIRRPLKEETKHHRPYGLIIRDIDIEIINNETWLDVPHYLYPEQAEGIYKVSSKGRFKGPCGLTIQTRNRNGSKYKTVTMYRRYYTHRVIWETFNGKIPKGYEVLHDDSAPLNSDGSYRNYLEDLRLGTRSENMKEFHDKPEETRQETSYEKPIEFKSNPTEKRCEEINPDDDEITKLMKCPPAGIQYCKETEKRGSKYSIGRAKTPEGMSDVSSTGRRNVSDRDKFIQIYKKYVEFGLNKC